jgi:hypothetical protein
MSPQRIIPLEPAGTEPSEPPALTDVVMALYLEGLPHDLREVEGEVLYAAGPLRTAATAVFALGCALGIEFPDFVEPVLRQTHDDVAEILDECREPLSQQVEEARASGSEVTAEVFMADLFAPLGEGEPIEDEVTYNILSIAFEYGCILASVQRAAAMVVRNAHNRATAAEPAPYAPGPSPDQKVQDLARELVAAYQKDFGLGAD